jgi:hypothetical protein
MSPNVPLFNVDGQLGVFVVVDSGHGAIIKIDAPLNIRLATAIMGWLSEDTDELIIRYV